QTQRDTGGTPAHRISDEHTGAVGVTRGGHGVVRHCRQTRGGRDIDVGGGCGLIEGVTGLGEPPRRGGGGQGDPLPAEALGRALAAIGHGGQGDLRVGQDLPDTLGQPGRRLAGGGGALVGIRRDDDGGGGWHGGPFACVGRPGALGAVTRNSIVRRVVFGNRRARAGITGGGINTSGATGFRSEERRVGKAERRGQGTRHKQNENNK